MPDEINTYELWELNSQEERNQKIQGLLEYCTNPTEDFIHELVAGQVRGLYKQLQPILSDDQSQTPYQD